MLHCKYHGGHGLCEGPYLAPYHKPRTQKEDFTHIFHLIEDNYPNGNPENGGLGYEYDTEPLGHGINEIGGYGFWCLCGEYFKRAVGGDSGYQPGEYSKYNDHLNEFLIRRI